MKHLCRFIIMIAALFFAMFLAWIDGAEPTWWTVSLILTLASALTGAWAIDDHQKEKERGR